MADSYKYLVLFDITVLFQIEGNIPLRIVLLLMDEIFDLKHRNQWLRRQIVAALQQLVRAVFGDRMNRKIVEYVDHAVAADQVGCEFLFQVINNTWKV